MSDRNLKNVQRITAHLRETLTYDMAEKAFRCRNGEESTDENDLELFINELIADAVNAGYDEWDDEFLDYD